jgi:hypothetical protein
MFIPVIAAPAEGIVMMPHAGSSNTQSAASPVLRESGLVSAER